MSYLKWGNRLRYIRQSNLFKTCGIGSQKGAGPVTGALYYIDRP